MKIAKHVTPRTGRGNKVLTGLAAAAIALIVLFVSLFVVAPAPHAVAETEGSVTIHVYDLAENYSKLSAWVWLKGGSGVEYRVSATADSNEKFGKGNNKAHTIQVPLTEKQVTALKGSSQLGFLICVQKANSGTFWDRYEKETVDVFVPLKNAFDANNHADVYYVRKDTAAYTDIEEGLQALEKIISATFTSKTEVRFETSTPLTNTVKASLFYGDDTPAHESVDITVTAVNTVGTAKFPKLTLDFSKDYILKLSTLPKGATVSKSGLIDTEEFIRTYENEDTQNQEYGAIYTKTATTFRLWAPFATSVTLNLYDDGMYGGSKANNKMKKRMLSNGTWGGVWEYTLNGDNNGVYYNYTIVNNGVETETMDPYAKACGTNGTRAMVIDLSTTNPAGWAEDATWFNPGKSAVGQNGVVVGSAADTPIVWEVSVNDFSSSADSGMKYKGKYLAFTEENTTVPGKPTLKTGVNYLKELGITYVHLNPVYDFSSVSEDDVTRADGGAFNWGYDPQNYNIPEGSYSTDPANGAVRINEFKRMVKALHDAGIGVIMDVVYNHTYNTAGQALQDTVPFYYHRTDTNGKFTDGAGCGNETASERTMMRKYMVESVLYWAKEYHVDGFRFDLMGLHDTTTLNMIRDELDSKVGKRILMYGEPWGGYGASTAASYTKRYNATRSMTLGKYVGNSGTQEMRNVYSSGFSNANAFSALRDRIAVFHDGGRDGLRGSNDGPGQGWANGNPGALSKVRRMMEGGVGDYAEGVQVGLASRCVSYACAHDNYTLWDQIRGIKQGNESALYYDDPIADDVKKCKLVSSAYMMSTGIAFMLAGEEMGRTKYGNENSYNSPIKLNQIVWSRQEKFKDLHDHYMNLIKIRRDNSTALFSYTKCAQSKSFATGGFNETNTSTGALDFQRPWENPVLKMTLNPSTKTGNIKINNVTKLSF